MYYAYKMTHYSDAMQPDAEKNVKSTMYVVTRIMWFRFITFW